MILLNYLIALFSSALATIYRLPTRVIFLLALCAIITAPKGERSWNLYHYWIGAKYLAELDTGATNLYECTLLALDKSLTRRDLKTYGFIEGESTCNKNNFTKLRWNEFVQDVKALEVKNNTLIDKGLNATPPWLAFAEPLAQTATPSGLVWIDIVALALSVIAVGYLTSWRKAGYVLLFIVSFYGIYDRWFGNFGQYIAVALSIAGTAMLHKSRNRLGGILIGAAAALRVFPIFLLLGKRKITWAYAIVTFLLFVLFGFTTSHGNEAYINMVENLHLHSNYIEREPYNIGLRQVITIALSPRAANEHMELIHTGIVESFNYQTSPILSAIITPLVFVSPIGIMFSLITLSRYYYVIVAIEGMKDDERPIRALFALNGLMLAGIGIDARTTFIYGHLGWIIIFVLYWYWNGQITAIGKPLRNHVRVIYNLFGTVLK